ncbi:hypothetical protein DH2020_013503 [Rehmannia glutinosa]|uniref:Retrotransposon gag domain-containing protein n=1 Tax=Rehmannia glutinosa TaxID=99300 RepID=A0ABR0X366_REHGL
MAPQRVNRNRNQAATDDETPTRNAPVQGNTGDLANIVANLVTIVQGLTQHNVANAQNGQNHHAPIDTTSQVVEQFWRYRLPVLTGREDPVVVEEWIGELESVFDLIACSEAHRVACAIFQLKQDAKYWWDLHRRTITDEEKNALTWKDFKELVARQFFPQAHRNKKAREFMSLVQGNMSVLDYERKFNQLSHYATHMVSIDQMKAERFVEGLRPELSGIISVLCDVTYAQIVDRARMVAVNMNLEGNPHKANEAPKRKWDGPTHNSGENKNKMTKAGRGPAQPPPQEKPQCPVCGKSHYGECLYGREFATGVRHQGTPQKTARSTTVQDRVRRQLGKMRGCML